jgi:4-hydroxy-tetrahydrodipicolinate reductase
MTNPNTPARVRVLVHGATGRMGQALMRLGSQRDDIQIVAAISRGMPSQRVVDGVPQFASSELQGAPKFDVAIDFSLPEGLDGVLALCLERNAAFVSGTTGLGESQRGALEAASGRIPILWASNFSLGVAVLGELVERAAVMLPGWDCDIVEAHHVHKQDAPSGTALTLGEFAEQGGALPRYASLRAGDIVGEHTVQFATAGERIELIHRATNRDVFAHGALHAASRLALRRPGLYRVRDVIG